MLPLSVGARADKAKQMAKDRRKDGAAQHAVHGHEPEKHDLKRKDYERSLRELHVKLVELQEWVRHKAKKVCILFEGRDGAGKGGAIKAITVWQDWAR